MESIPSWRYRQLKRGQVWKDEAVQKWLFLETQYELLQIDGVAEKGERGRSHGVGLASRPGILDEADFEGMEERVRSRINVREPLDIFPGVGHEIEGPDLVSVGRK